MSDLKKCSKCKTLMPSDNFGKAKNSKCGLTSQCKECISLSRKIYYKENKQKFEDYYEKNRERVLSYARKSYEENTEKFNARIAAYRIARPDVISLSRKKSNYKRRGAAGSHTAADVRAIFDSQRGLCANCKKKLLKSGKNVFHVDHINPISKGGSNDKHNIQCLCPGCNLSKHSKDPIEWAIKNGRLL